jgi:hypothetical protein
MGFTLMYSTTNKNNMITALVEALNHSILALAKVSFFDLKQGCVPCVYMVVPAELNIIKITRYSKKIAPEEQNIKPFVWLLCSQCKTIILLLIICCSSGAIKKQEMNLILIFRNYTNSSSFL